MTEDARGTGEALRVLHKQYGLQTQSVRKPNDAQGVRHIHSTDETVNKISGGGKSRGAVLTALTCETISKRKHLLYTEIVFTVLRDRERRTNK